MNTLEVIATLSYDEVNLGNDTKLLHTYETNLELLQRIYND